RVARHVHRKIKVQVPQNTIIKYTQRRTIKHKTTQQSKHPQNTSGSSIKLNFV
ncbi:MAG: hypothetical protein ACI90V_002783, partial [Bacillariaceae sp.]